MDKIYVELSAEKITEFLGIPITDALLASWIVVFLVVLGALFSRKKIKLIPGKIQVLFEFLILYVKDYMTETLESERLAKKFLPFVLTIFLFIFFANMFGFLPGIGSIGIYETIGEEKEFISLLRPVNTDLNVTVALAIISFVVIEVTGVATLGFLKYFSKFVNFKSPLAFLIGIIELFSEIARLIAFSFRLFGNMFAGKVLVLVVMFFVPYLLPVPILLFEVFVGFIQAAIFALLTLFFIKIAITEPH